VTDDSNDVCGRILADMRGIWGEMATAMLRKRLRDVCADPAQLTPDQLRAVVQLLQEKTLPSVLGPDGAERKAKLWMSWMDDAGA
jgi:hypothetical protein